MEEKEEEEEEEERERLHLVPARFVRDILHVAVNVVHWVGHGGDVLLGCAGGGGVVDFVGHVCCAVLVLLGGSFRCC